MGVYSFKKQRLRGIIGTSSMKVLSNYIRIKDMSYTERLDKLIYDQWKKRRIRADLIEVYKMVHCLLYHLKTCLNLITVVAAEVILLN